MKLTRQKLSVLIIALLAVGLIALGVAYGKLAEENRYIIRSIDDRMTGSFVDVIQSRFHDVEGMDEESLQRLYRDSAGSAYLAFTLFNISSYQENHELNRILYALHQWSEEGALFERLDLETADELNRLVAQNQLDDPEQIHRAYEMMFGQDGT